MIYSAKEISSGSKVVDSATNGNIVADGVEIQVYNEANVIKEGDARLTDARTPLSHPHAATEITSGTLADARLSPNVVLKNGLNVLAQDLELSTISSGIILKSPNGSKFKITVNNQGSLVSTPL